MQTAQEKYEELVSQYQHVVSDDLLPKIALYDYIGSRLQEEQEEWLELEPLLFILFQSLELDVMLTLAKFLEQNADRSIFHFLNFSASNRTKIKWRNDDPLGQEVIDANRNELAKHSDLVQRIKTRRDKYLAHSDKEYFLQPHKLDKDHPVTTVEVIALLQSLQTIMGEHSVGLTGSARVSTEGWFQIHAANLMQKIYRGTTAGYAKR